MFPIKRSMQMYTKRWMQMVRLFRREANRWRKSRIYTKRMFSEVERLGIEDKVEFVGGKEAMDLIDIYQSADILVITAALLWLVWCNDYLL